MLKINNRRRPPKRRGDGPALKIIRADRPTKRQLHVNVRIDPAGNHELAAGIN